MRHSSPPPLTVAASLVAVQGLALVGLAVFVLAGLSKDRLTLGFTTAIFFGLYAALLLAGGWALSRMESWPRGPVLFTQLVALGLAWNLRSDQTFAGIVLALVAAGVIAGMLHPASMAALSGDPDDDE